MFLEFIFLQLIHTRATRDDHRLDIKIVQGVGHAVEQHAVVHDDFLALVFLACRGLWIAAAQIAGWQDCGGANLIEHGLRSESDLREQAFRTAAREIEHGVRFIRRFLWIADHRNYLVIFNIQ